MTATLDDLLARADRVEQRDEPTRDELMRELEDALNELETKFPNGEPHGEGQLRYGTLMLRVTVRKMCLEDGDYATEPVPVLTLVVGGADAE